jgi:hypothetical protein
MHQQQHPNDQLSMQGGFNLFYILLYGHALTCTVFLRTSFGREGIGLAGMAGFFIIMFYGGMMNSYAMFYFLGAYLLAVIGQRMKQFDNWRKGIVVHSRYNGFPIVAWKLFPRIKTEGNAKAAEAFLCLGLGWLLMTFVDQPLGWYVMAGFLSILFSEAFIVEAQRRRLQAMRDAEIEQQCLADAYREGRF